MEINKEVFEALIIFLYKMGAYDSCEKVLETYARLFTDEHEPDIYILEKTEYH